LKKNQPLWLFLLPVFCLRFCPQVFEQPLKALLKAGLILPIGKIGYEILTDLSGKVLAGVRVKALFSRRAAATQGRGIAPPFRPSSASNGYTPEPLN
jgi:hypothetical protein